MVIKALRDILGLKDQMDLTECLVRRDQMVSPGLKERKERKASQECKDKRVTLAGWGLLAGKAIQGNRALLGRLDKKENAEPRDKKESLE